MVFLCLWGMDQVFPQILVVLGATNHTEVVAGGGRETFRVVLSHTLQTNEVGLPGLCFMAVDYCAVVADELQAEFIYEHVEGAKRWPSQEWGQVKSCDKHVQMTCLDPNRVQPPFRTFHMFIDEL